MSDHEDEQILMRSNVRVRRSCRSAAASCGSRERKRDTRCFAQSRHPACLRRLSPSSLPPEARRAKILEGNVLLEITVSEKGRPGDIEVLSDPGNGFAREAVAAVKHWKFKPALAKDGRKISTRIQIHVVSRQM